MTHIAADFRLAFLGNRKKTNRIGSFKVAEQLRNMFLDSPIRPPRTHRYVEEAFKQVKARKNVRDVVILNDAGNPVRTTMDRDDAVHFSGHFQAIRGRLERGMSKIDPKDELLMLRVRTKTNEVLLVPDSKITVLVVQDAQDNFEK